RRGGAVRGGRTGSGASLRFGAHRRAHTIERRWARLIGAPPPAPSSRRYGRPPPRVPGSFWRISRARHVLALGANIPRENTIPTPSATRSTTRSVPGARGAPGAPPRAIIGERRRRPRRTPRRRAPRLHVDRVELRRPLHDELEARRDVSPHERLD